MDGHNYLGIHLGKDTATVVCLGWRGRGHKVLGCFSVSVEDTEGQNQRELARLIVEGCAERELKFSEVAAALDCSMFMQHNVHSEFSDPKQIAQTIRFDAEEALSTDISGVAIAFRIASSGQAGSELTVFTAERRILSDALHSLQSHNIDPITIEPDVYSLSRFISQRVSVQEDLHTLFGILSRRSGYFVAVAKSQEAPSVRTFLASSMENRTNLLEREVPVTSALFGAGEPIDCLKVFDSAGSVNCQPLSEKLGIEASSIDLAESAHAEPEALGDCADTVDFAVACGAALANLEKTYNVNFRDDFMPYEGKRARLQKTLKFLGISITVVMLALGTYFQMQLLRRNIPRRRLRDKFEKQYSVVMAGKKLPARLDPVKKLEGELRRTRAFIKGGGIILGEESISTKLMLVLKAFNECAASTRLEIDRIYVTGKTMSIVGSTSNQKTTLRLFNAIKKNKLDILSESMDRKGGRGNFSITVAPKKG